MMIFRDWSICSIGNFFENATDEQEVVFFMSLSWKG